ncbi:MAG: helix-turn-helix domain-containing protein [Treponema sp.]
MSDYFETVRFNIKHYREIRGISQAKLAELANCSNGLIGLIESGKAKPSFDTLTAIADSLSVHPADLFLRDTSKSKDEIKGIIETALIRDIQKILEEHF